VQAKYGFLYASYSERLPYWETTEMIRKFAIAFIPVSIAVAAVPCVCWVHMMEGSACGSAQGCPATLRCPLTSTRPCPPILPTHHPPTHPPAGLHPGPS
jgi:hypothetical protein